MRPWCFEFLEALTNYYEIVIFTASVEKAADLIIDKLDPKKQMIRHRLYRHHTIKSKSVAVKDLARLGRPLERTLIIDNRRENFVRQPENGIKCHTWTGSQYDRQLLKLQEFLTKMALQRPSDVRPHIAEFKKTARF